MVEIDKQYNQFWSLGFFLLFSVIIVGLSVIIVVANNDYLFFEFQTMAETLIANGNIGSNILGTLESIADANLGILVYIDVLWAISFVTFVISYIKSSYDSKRNGMLSLFGFLTFGVMAIIWLLNILTPYSDYLYDLLFNQVLGNVTLSLTFFNMYLSNYNYINLILLITGLILNFVPFDFTQFRTRKGNDTISEEEVL